MRKRTTIIFGAVALACGSLAPLPRNARGPLVLEVRGSIENGPFKLGKDDLAGAKRRTVRGTDPADGRTAAWEGVDLAALLEHVELKRGVDTVVVHTEEKRAIAIPLTLVRQAKPVLAERADGQPIPERIIAWPSADQRGLASDPRIRLWWARTPILLELVSGFQTYGRSLSVAEGAPTGARVGAGLFESRCSACHVVRKVGGKNAPDLTRVADRLDEAGLARVLGKHPGWTDGDGPPDAPALAQLWAFFRAIAFDPAGPAEEPTPPAPRPPVPPSPSRY